METQSAPTSQPLENAALLPDLRRQATAPGRPAIRPAALAARKAARLSEERQRLLIEMFPLVKRMAFKIREHLPSHIEVDDLIANGMVGLVDAVSKFDASKRVKLESYARHRVRGSILDGLRSADPASRDLRKKNKKIQKLYRELEAKLVRTVADEDMAAALGLGLDKWHDTLNEIQTLGFDFGPRTLSAGPTTRRMPIEPEQLAHDDDGPFDLCYEREKGEIMAQALTRLRDREREIISLYYEQELTMNQIATRLKIDESRVSQLHSSAIARLKATVKSLLHPASPDRPGTASKLSLSVGAGG